MRTSTFTRQLAASVRLLLVLTVLLGVAYPATVWGVGRLGLSSQADGSRVERGGVVVGSSLLGQQFTEPGQFHGRPSASDNSGQTSGGSNLAAGSQDQRAAVADRQRAYAATGGRGEAPADALTASASGLDPDISPAYALAQVPRVAVARGLPEARVGALVRQHIQGRVLGFLGEPRVNVLELNLALDRLAGTGR